MSQLLRKALAATIAAALVLAVPVATAAEPAPKGIQGAFELHGTHGYELRGLIASTGRSGVLILYVDKKDARAEYIVHGMVTTESANFELGKLGRIEIAVQRTGRTETVHPSCGKPFAAEAIEYVGTIEFHGEEGFTEAATASTPLTLKPLAELVCPGGGFSEAFGGRGPGFKLRTTMKGGPSLMLQRNPGNHARVYYEARIKEKDASVTVHRTLWGHLPSRVLHVDKAYDAVSFAPGAPFSGKATYAQTRPPRDSRRDIGTWRGDLVADFPGRAHVRLAGPGFLASTMHATRQVTRP
jgi:hypothetical protein